MTENIDIIKKASHNWIHSILFRARADFSLLKVRCSYLFLHSDVDVPRFWISLLSILYGFLFAFSDTSTGNLRIAHAIAPNFGWFSLFFLHGFCSFYSVIFRKYTKTFLWIDGILGVSLWGAVSIAQSLAIHSIYPTCLVAFACMWLLIRYQVEPTVDFTQTLILRLSKRKK